MGTLTLSLMRSLIRSHLNESSTVTLSDTELNTLINDGYKDVAIKALCYENKITKDNISISQKVVSLVGENVIRVNFVEYKSGTTEGGWGMLCVSPKTVGHSKIDGSSPQSWFQWGDYIYVEPLPNVATYDLAVYASCYPSAVLSNDSDLCDDIPVEFHECVYLFALAFANLKLKRWSDFSLTYNRYIGTIQNHRNEYMIKYPDGRFAHELPSKVTMEAVGGR
jgi:hypothetical protein